MSEKKYPNIPLVQALERALADAKEGNLQGAALALYDNTGGVSIEVVWEGQSMLVLMGAHRAMGLQIDNMVRESVSAESMGNGRPN